ncbi:MAG TPA: hypothetical protein VFQ05_14515 [Candidatus Eisenbacteria bacterium]|nr:hypothetical protein [Candidatus Eisenbacteria bacterium]
MKGLIATTRWIGVFAFLAYVLSGGGRVVGSDEVSMLELSRSILHGRLDIPAGATLAGPDGRHYTKNAAGQAVLALPLVAAAEGIAAVSGLDGLRRTLAVRFIASFFNAWVVALLLGVFYGAARGLQIRPRAALLATLMLGFATPLWVYAKSFMAEPLQGLGLLLALAGSAKAEDPKARFIAAIGLFLAISVKASMLPIALLCISPVLMARPLRDTRPLAIAFALAVAGHLIYNGARFGNPLESGYGAQATPAAYTTPLLIGLYGLLISSGKGVLWFAPPLWLAPRGWKTMWLKPPVARRAAVGAMLAFGAALVLYGTFEHWAGDGSFGPRYLVPLLPPAFLAVAFALDSTSRAIRAAALVLGALGLVVQLGGVSIHFGAQMREAGDYPYTRALDDPRFMSDSHFNPSFSPIVAHWRMLSRNVAEHARGEVPRLSGRGQIDERVGIGRGDQARMLHALDFWWLYMLYAGLPVWPIALMMVLLIGGMVWAALQLQAAVEAEARQA